MTKVAVAKWGNSAAIRLPKAVVDSLGIAPGQALEMTLTNNSVTFVPFRTNRITLDWIISETKRLGAENTPATVVWGADRGEEKIDDEYSRRR